MSDTSNDKTNSNPAGDEVDIGYLFVMIGQAIMAVLQFFKTLIIGIAEGFVLFLLFTRNHLKKLTLAALLGFGLGAIYQYGIKEVQFESSMTVEPNFGSAVQLYKNVEYFENLIEQKDFERLATSLNISVEEAESISNIEVVPYSNKNQTLLSYKEFMASLDSLTRDEIDFKAYSRSQPVESFKYHIVTVRAKNKYFFDKLELPIINSVVQNRYYDQVKNTAHQNLRNRRSALVNSMNELDSLKDLYKKVMIAESEKAASQTAIYLSSTPQDRKEVEVFDKYMQMNQQLMDVNKQLTEENEVINVVSNFNAIGTKVNDWYKNTAVLGAIGFFGLLYLLLGLRHLNLALLKFEESRNLRS